MNELITVKDVNQCLAHSKCSLNVIIIMNGPLREGKGSGSKEAELIAPSIPVSQWSPKNQMFTGMWEENDRTVLCFWFSF